MSDFNSQGLANIAWTFVTARQSNAQLFTMLARNAERSLCDFNHQALSTSVDYWHQAPQQ